MIEGGAPTAESVPAPGLRSSLRGFAAALVEALRTRLDLAAVELEIHLLVLVRVLVCVMGAVACALLALAFAVTALIVALWDSHRLLGLLGAVVLFVALGALFGWLGARTLRRTPRALEGSLQLLREDERRARGEP
jgi:uncharacterized membrane protein YqjE